MITLTDSAINAVNRFISQSGKSVAGLRIRVADGGCSGLQYALRLEEAVGENDIIQEIKGLTMLIDEESQSVLDGVTVDFIDSMEGSGFKFENPNAKNACGCGKSFSA